MKKPLAHKETIHRLANKWQAMLAYLELDEHDKAIRAAKETVTELHRIKASRAAKETITQLNLMTDNKASSHVRLPKGGSVVVAPHGTRVVSHEDVTVDVDSDEVRVVDQSSVRTGHGTHNPKTK
jgi:ribosome biogenesis protein Tsr3